MAGGPIGALRGNLQILDSGAMLLEEYLRPYSMECRIGGRWFDRKEVRPSKPQARRNG